MIGNQIQNYKIEEMLGEGGMGTVYRATDTMLKRAVAIKVFHEHLLRDESFIERFNNEAVLSAQLNHPNVATLYNILQDKGNNLMVMEYIDGKTLEQTVRQYGNKLPIDITLKIVMQSLEGLQHAHDKGILHRDLKPANIMLNRSGAVKLMDFGIARMMGTQRMTRVNKVIGTLEYMAPELLEGSEPSVQSDLYAMGVLIFELLTGQMPFTATADTSLINQILNKKPHQLQHFIANIPKPIEVIVEKLLQKKPEKRYKSASELNKAIATISNPGLADMRQLEARPTVEVQSPHSVSNPAVQKSDPVPARLPTSQAEHRKTFGYYWQLFQRQLLTVEGMILAGSCLIALAILGFGIGMTDSPENDKKQLTETKSDSIPKVEVAQQVENDTVKTVLLDPIAFNTGSKKYGGYEKEKEADKPKKEIVNENKKATRPLKPAEKEKILKKETVQIPEEHKPEPEPTKPRFSGALPFANIYFSAEMTQRLSSENTSMDGQEIRLSVSEPVQIGGITVIAKGAAVRAKITDVKSIEKSKMAIIQIYIREVQTVDGQWIDVKAERYTEKGYSEIVFERGKRIGNLKTGKATVYF
jgi:eukaryotic-like serine/threonine-protein kinase